MDNSYINPISQNHIHYYTNHSIILVETAEQTSKIVFEVLFHEKVLALDCEGIKLSKDGALTLIQVKYSFFILFYFRLG